MKTRNMIQNSVMLAALGLATLVGLTACSDDDNGLSGKDSENIALTDDDAADIVGGKLFHVIDAGNLSQYKLPLWTLAELELVADENPYFGLKIEQTDGHWYVVPYAKQEMEEEVEVIPVSILPRKNPKQGRTVIFVFVKSEDEDADTRAWSDDDYIPEGLMSAYQDVIGRGTHCFSGVGDFSSNQIVDPAKYKKLRRNGYLTPNTTNNKTLLLQKHAEDYEQMMESWSLNIGLSTHYKTGIRSVFDMIPDANFEPDAFALIRWEALGESWEDHIPLIPHLRDQYTYTFDGSLNISGSNSLEATSDYEYFIQMLLVKRAEVALNINALSLDDKLFCSIFTDAFLNVIEASYNKLARTVPGLTGDNFAQWFYEEWGTDVITQGTFGGSYINIYGRMQNTYNSDIAFDANAHIKRTKTKVTDQKSDHPLTLGEAWLQVLALQGSNYASLDVGATYNKENYSSASNAVTFEMQIGGNPSADQNPSDWIAGLKDNSKSDNWALISYLTSSDYSHLYETGNGADECAEMIDDPSNRNFTDGLFPIEMLMFNYVSCYTELSSFRTEADEKALENIMDKVNRLSEYRQTLLNDHVRKMTDGPRLVLADLMMLSADNNHSVNPEPFVGKNPRGFDAQEYLIYYPVMSNPVYGLGDKGYPFETSGDDFNVAADTQDHYWYYALAPENRVTGFTEARFTHESPGTGWSTPRGDDARSGMGGLLVTQNQVYLKWFDEKVDNPSRKATAVAFGWKMKEPKSIWASTGGSELARNITASELEDWTAWWTWSGNDKDPYITDCSKDGTAFYEGGGVHPHWLGMLVSCKDLPIKKMSDRTVCHPLKWGEVN